MKDCIIILPYGRNMSSILEDTSRYLSGKYNIERIVPIALDRDRQSDTPEGTLFLRPDGGYTFPPELWMKNTVVFFVLNGGTTAQQWAVMRMYNYRVAIGNDYIRDYPEDEQFSFLSVPLDVQRDGVTKLM